MYDRLLNAVASFITIALFITTYLLHGFGRHRAILSLTVDTRVALFLLTQIAVAYLVHVAVMRIPFATPGVKIWLIASSVIIIAQWATILSLRLFDPSASILLR